MVGIETLAVPGADLTLPSTVDADGLTKGAPKYAQIGPHCASQLLSAAIDP